MQTWKAIASGLALSIALSGAAWPAEITIPRSLPATPAATVPTAPAEFDCRKSGNEASALIDISATSRNLPAARAAFQRGVMDCMEGDAEQAEKYYQEVRRLLGREPAKTPGVPK